VSEKYEFVETMLTDSDCEYPIHLMCLWLAVSRLGVLRLAWPATIGDRAPAERVEGTDRDRVRRL